MAGGAAFALASAADPLDPYIVAQAQLLNNDPNQIFAFVRDKIAFQAYHGSVHGARGTLWSLGGNSLDRASLLIALLGAAGISATYVQGTLAPAATQNLILSMFSKPSRIVGCLLPGTTLALPGGDATLQSDITDHYWVEFGNAHTSADPNFSGAQLGQTFATAEQRFISIPQALRQTVTIRLNVELAGGIFGAVDVSPATTQLTQTFESALMVGMPVSIGHNVSGGTSGGGIFGPFVTTYTYTPYFLLGQGGVDVELDPVVQGTPYQESISLFSTTFVSGVFLEVDAPNQKGIMQTYRHTLVDRVGFANRQANILSPTSPGANNPPPVVAPTDVVTVNILPGLQSNDAFPNQKTRVQTEQQRMAALQPALAALPTSGGLTAQQQTTLGLGIRTQSYLSVALNELDTMTFAGTSDHMLSQLQSVYLSDAYYNSPRLVVGTANSSGIFSLDLLKRDVRVVASPGQNSKAPYLFEVARGMAESSSEAKVLNQVLGQPAIDISNVFATLPANGAKMINHSLLTAGLVSLPALSADAVARIKVALQNNIAVIAPATTPTVSGQPVNMWLEINQLTGETVSVSDTGSHQGIILSWIASLASFFLGKYSSFTQIAGYGVTGYSFAAGVLSGVAAFAGGAKLSKESVAGGGSESPLAPYVEAAFKQEDEILNQIITPPVPTPPDVLPPGVEGLIGLVEGLKYGAESSQGAFLRMLPADPHVFQFLSSDIIPGPAAVAPGNSPAVNLNLALDVFFTQPYSGGDAPTVFIANIQNAGPTADTFSLQLGSLPGYQLISSVPNIRVPAGQTGQIGICAVPTGNTTPAGTLTAKVTSTGNPGVTSVTAAGVSGGPSQPAALAVSGPAALPSGNAGLAYTATKVTASGGTGFYSWSATGLPANITIAADTGIISGTPSTSTGSPFHVKVTVSDGSTTAFANFDLVISAFGKCDVTQDGQTNLADVLHVITTALGTSTVLDDLNKDGLVNVLDGQISVNAAMGLGCIAQ